MTALGMAHRQIVLDTETTGLSFNTGHRIIEIGCVEIIDGSMTDSGIFHCYINPGRSVPAESVAVHGITLDMLKNQPKFAMIAKQFLDYVANAEIIAHNASFDIGFLNGELLLSGFTCLSNAVIDTLSLAKKLFPGSPASLDALCQRFGVNIKERRRKHGALVDAKLLASIYLQMTSGSQTDLEFRPSTKFEQKVVQSSNSKPENAKMFRIVEPLQEEISMHNKSIAEIQNSIWKELLN